jgi:hypothetical protein
MTDYIDAHPEGDIVYATPEQVLACREILIGCARSRRMITLAELYDRLVKPGMPVRRLPDTETSDWLVWTYGLLQLVCDDCQRRGEPLLPSLVTKSDGGVW